MPKPPKPPKPRWKNGRLDPDWLGAAGLGFVRAWLASRLAGSDPYQPVDTRIDEDPDAFVVELLREVGAHHPAFEVIARAVLQLLDEARGAAPEVPAYFRGLLRICQQVRLPQTSGWFGEEMDALAREMNRREEQWGGYEAGKEIAYAAVTQAPGLTVAASRAAWERLLGVPRYATIAFIALSQTFSDQVRHLGRWWAACEAGERGRELAQLLDSALRREGEARVRSLLASHVASLPRDLEQEIDAVFRGLQLREVFVWRRTNGRALTSAIDGAARKRRYVLEQDPIAAE
jgi:hypothetical protein